MLNDTDACYQAIKAHDARYDGRLFVGVTSTGIYCRPVCRVRTPKRANCRFFTHAAAAEEAGFRPCLRCRPETAPGCAAWSGTEATVSRALALIEAGALDGRKTEEFASRLGLGERHLRRLFQRHVGATPAGIARTRRVQLAKKLIDETSLPMIEIAGLAGFPSVRRFNEAFRQSYRMAPTDLRRRARTDDAAGAAGSGLTLHLDYRAPFDWSQLLAFLEARAIPGCEQVRGGVYSRSVTFDGAVGIVEVADDARYNRLAVRVRLSKPLSLLALAGRLRALFDLEAEPSVITAHLSRDPLLKARVRRHPGLRVPGCWDPFELGVRAILGQQVSVAGARTLAGRLVEGFGAALPDELADADLGLTHLFPEPAVVARIGDAHLSMPRKRAEALRAFARACDEGAIDLSGATESAEVERQLCALPGIGKWTAGYIAMRALHLPDAFPEKDLGLLRAVSDRINDHAELTQRAETWRPWRAYAAMHLWMGE